MRLILSVLSLTPTSFLFIPSVLIFFNFSLPKKLTSLSMLIYLSNPHSYGLSPLSISFPYDNNPLSIRSIKFGQPGLILNSFQFQKDDHIILIQKHYAQHKFHSHLV